MLWNLYRVGIPSAWRRLGLTLLPPHPMMNYLRIDKYIVVRCLDDFQSLQLATQPPEMSLNSLQLEITLEISMQN